MEWKTIAKYIDSETGEQITKKTIQTQLLHNQKNKTCQTNNSHNKNY